MNHIHVFSSFLGCSPQALLHAYPLADSILLTQWHPPLSRHHVQVHWRAMTARIWYAGISQQATKLLSKPYVRMKPHSALARVCESSRGIHVCLLHCHGRYLQFVNRVFAIQSISSSTIMLLLSLLKGIGLKCQSCQSVERQSACSQTCLLWA